MKTYIVDYCVESEHGLDCDTAIVLAESEDKVKSVLENYIHNFNENYGIWVSDTCKIPINNDCKFHSIYSTKEFTGSVFTRLFQDDDDFKAEVK